MSQPPSENPYSSPHAEPHRPQTPYPMPEGDATGGVIPYKNPAALIAYYLGLVSLFPCLGILPAIPALVLGIMGLRARAKNPAIKGSVHAWIGIIMGGLFTLIWGAGIIFLIVAIIAENS